MEVAVSINHVDDDVKIIKVDGSSYIKTGSYYTVRDVVTNRLLYITAANIPKSEYPEIRRKHVGKRLSVVNREYLEDVRVRNF